ncbi:hypothetical protein CU097_005004 [Rhizopus azygosporus]|uniref:Uncharacterized protein n=1 Tax=Rhizopus azygosporus TaxID=86630 RepID=A0A367IZ65_RHIAZ|nr:hypothetical protein CU097_005004 [Rhizopus azygosporus]
MKFFAVASGFALALTGALAQVTAPMQNYNVTSPVMNGAYVAGQMLPCTVTIFENVPADISLSVSLVSAANSSTSFVIASTLDTSKSPDSVRTKNNVTYYEHSVNYNIPTNIPLGSYNVVFLDSKTNTQTPVPITILPVSSSSVVPSAAATGSSGTPSSTNASIFKNDAVTTVSPAKAILSLAAVAVLASML